MAVGLDGGDTDDTLVRSSPLTTRQALTDRAVLVALVAGLGITPTSSSAARDADDVAEVHLTVALLRFASVGSDGATTTPLIADRDPSEAGAIPETESDIVIPSLEADP